MSLLREIVQNLGRPLQTVDVRGADSFQYWKLSLRKIPESMYLLLLFVSAIANLPSGKSTFTNHILQPFECSIMALVAFFTLLTVCVFLRTPIS
jgi:hypothetical protein